MTNYKDILIQLTQNLNLLHEREAKYGGNAPLDVYLNRYDRPKVNVLTPPVSRS